MKKTLLLLYIIVTGFCAFGQNDSLALARANWKSKEIAPGIFWKSVRFTKNELFNANESINMVEISPRGAANSKLHIVHSDSLETTSQMARTRNELAAINGSFFKMRGADPDYHPGLNGVPKMEPSKIDRNRSVVYLRENDSLISENIPDKDNTRKRHQQGSIIINKGKLSILRADSADLNWEHAIIGQDILSTGPVMILSGNNQLIPNDAFCNDRHPRTAIAKKPDGTVVLFVVDGRASESAGMSIHELQKTLRWLGCSDAINLDGGGSSTMFIKGQPYSGVVNYPTDNKKFDHEGEREVANVILLIQQ